MQYDIVNDEQYKQYLKSPKWQAIAKKRLEIDNYKCQGCGCRGTSNNPIECHHMTYAHKYQEENHIYTDLVCLCHCCHKNVHNIMVRITNEQGRRGWKDNVSIPQINVFTISGEEILSREENRK